MSLAPVIEFHASLPSTMDEARILANTDANEFTVVQAGEQTAGRGRFGNQWSSPTGNLYMTIILRPDMPTRLCAQISFALALALSDTLKGTGAKLKWPNDVLIEGKKVAGILLELEASEKETPDYMLVGMGVNIISGPEGSAVVTDYLPTTVDDFRDALLENLAGWYERWLNEPFAVIRSAWLERAQGIGMPVTVRMNDRKLDGHFDGLDQDGNLVLRHDDGSTRIISSGDVHFRPVP